MDSIVLCAVVQDAAASLLEWLAFHRMIGVDRFVVYDQSHIDAAATLVARSRFARHATVIRRAREDDRVAIYQDFVANHAADATWTALLDPNEFLHPVATDSLRSLLPRYHGFSIVMLPRLSFPVSPRHRPGQLLVAGCTNRLPDGSSRNVILATLLRVMDVQSIRGPPPAFTMAGDACDGSGRRMPADQVDASVLVVNRYLRLSGPEETVQDRRILRFVPRLRAMLHDGVPAPTMRGAATPAPAQEPLPAVAAAASPVAPTRPAPAPTLPMLGAPLSSAAARPAPAAPAGPVPAAPAGPAPAAFAGPAPVAAAGPAPAPLAGPTQSVPAGHSPAIPVGASPAAPAGRAPVVACASSVGADPASPLLGIGIVTYNRAGVLAKTLDRVQRHTTHPHTIVAVADDGSTDDTMQMLRARQVLAVSGTNAGVAWNKNRALFLLFALRRCDVVILLEDDAYPTRDGWHAEWIEAARRWGHVNLAADWLREHFISGKGTAADPILSRQLTAQCAVFSRESILFGGYFDTRFRGYGHEHVEHTWRLLRMGYGGSEWPPDSKTAPEFRLIWGGIAHQFAPSVGDAGDWQTERNRVLAQLLLGEYSHRPPFQTEQEARQLREEMRQALPHAPW